MKYDIYRVERPDAVAAKISPVKDDIEKRMPCTRSVWIKNLADMVAARTESDEHFWDVWVAENEIGEVESYVVIQMPTTFISNGASVIYYWPLRQAQEMKKLLEIVSQYLKDKGVPFLEIMTRKPSLYEHLNFKVYGSLMRLDLN